MEIWHSALSNEPELNLNQETALKQRDHIEKQHYWVFLSPAVRIQQAINLEDSTQNCDWLV